MSHLWINGQNCNATDGALYDIHSPANGRVIGQAAAASVADIEKAIASAEAAFVIWSNKTAYERETIMRGATAQVRTQAEEIGRLMALEQGKPWSQATGEVHGACDMIDYYASEAPRIEGTLPPTEKSSFRSWVTHHPVGVCAGITPWNYPAAMGTRKIAPALAFGNAVIWKPANLTPASAVELTKIIAKQDIPPGLFNLVMGSGGSIGQALVESPGVDAISFTGSVPVGKGIAASAIGNLTKLQMEMGSKNALAVMEDADLDLAVTVALGGAFGGSGQKCTASSRLVVHADVNDEFTGRLVAGAKAMKVGHALAEGTQIGPVVSAGQLQANLDNIALGASEGATLLCGGERVDQPTEGYYMSPAVFADTTNDMQINREELFAPATSVIKVSGYEEALSVVNDTNFGLTSGIVTRDLARATHFRQNARTGCVMVNLPTAGTDYHVPFGGRGDSSYGPREQGSYAAEFYTTVKTAYVAAGSPK